MRYTLKDYQNNAVADVLAHLKRARMTGIDGTRRWRSRSRRLRARARR